MSGNATTTASNFTGLYSGSGGTTVPTTPYGNANVVSLLAAGSDGGNTVGNISATGNITGNYFLGNGSQLTGLPATYSNANVTTLLANFGSNVISTTGNVTGGNLQTTGVVSATGNITTAGYFLGTFAGNISGNLTVPGSNTQVLYNNNGNAGASTGFTFDSASNVATVAGNIVGGNVTTAGNVTGNYILGNGSQLTGLPATYGNANVATFLAAFGSNTISTTGTVTAGNVTGGNLLTPGVVSATGNVTGAYFIGNGSQLTGIVSSTYGNAQVATYLSSGTVTSNIITTANISGGYILGNGSQLTGLPANYGNSNVTTLLAAFGSNTISTTGNVDSGNINAANLYSSGVVSAAGNVRGSNINTTGVVSATGNITGNYILGNGSQLTGIAGTYSNADVTSLLASFGSNSISTTGNVTAGNFFGNGAGLTSITGANVTGTVANATFATTAGTANTANTAITVTGNAQANITSVGTLTSLSVSGNINGSNVNASTVQATTSAGLALKNLGGTTQASMGAGGGDNFTIAVSTNMSGANAQIDISPTGNSGHVHIKPTGTPSIEIAPIYTGSINNMVIGNVTPAAVSGTTVSATGNITGNYFIGNGSQLTGLPAGYSNADVATFLAAFGSNSISTTGNVTAGNFAGNGSALSAITGANVSGTVANATYAVSAGTATSATTAGTVTTAAQPNITSVGTLTSLTSSGNITASYFLGNGSQLTGVGVSVPGSNTNVIFNDAGAFGATAGFTFNKTSNALATTGAISAAGNITGANFSSGGDANVSRIFTAANADIGGNLLVSGAINALGSAVTAAQFSASGNVTVQQNVLTSGFITSQSYISAVGNVSGNYFIGNGSLLTGVQSNATTSIQNGTSNVNIQTANGNVTIAVGGVARATFANISTTLNGNTAVGYDLTVGNDLSTVTANITNTLSVGVGAGLGTISATGNITGNYFVGNGSQLTGIIGTAAGTNTQITYNNAGTSAGSAAMTFDNTVSNVTLSNLIIGTNAIGNLDAGNAATRINTSNAFSGTLGTTSGLNPGQIVIGNGYFGNLDLRSTQFAAARGAKFLVWDSATITDGSNVGIRYNGFAATPQLIFGNIANTNNAIRGTQSGIGVGGGASANTVTVGTPFGIAAHAAVMAIGQPNASVALGNVTINFASGIASQTATYAGSNIGNLVASPVQINNAANITNMAGYLPQFTGTASTTPTNVYGYYMPGSSVSSGSFGVSNSNTHRAATNYYFLRNDDAVAQVQLGSLRSYNEYNYINPTTSGALTIDKVNAQVQQVNLTGNISSITYANLVTSLSDGTNTDEEVDTVTIIFNQGTTGGYGVTFPTGSTYKYANGVTTLQSFAANSVSLVSVTATRISGTTTYLTTISPGFV